MKIKANRQQRAQCSKNSLYFLHFGHWPCSAVEIRLNTGRRVANRRAQLPVARNACGWQLAPALAPATEELCQETEVSSRKPHRRKAEDRRLQYRWVPFNPKTDYPNSRSIRSQGCGNHMQIFHVLIRLLNSKFTFPKNGFFQLNGRYMFCICSVHTLGRKLSVRLEKKTWKKPFLPVLM